MTDTVEVLPALTTTLAALAVEPIWPVTVQPSGPVAATLNGRSLEVLLFRVSENVNVVSVEPLSWGVSVVSVTLPAALGETRMLVVMVAVAPLEVTPLTSICCVLAAASAGIVTLSVSLTGVVPSDSTPSTVKPPPRRTAVQPSGTLPTVRATRLAVLVVTVTSKLGFAPGATEIAGNGVVMVSGEAAIAAGAADSSASPSIDATSPKRAMRDRPSTALDTTDTSHLLRYGSDWRLLGDSRSRARALRASGAESDAPRGFEINQRSVKRPQPSAGRTTPTFTQDHRRFDGSLVRERYFMSNQSAATTRLERPTRAPGPARRHLRSLVQATNHEPGRSPGRAADRRNRDHGAPESTSTSTTMMNRSTTSSVTGRASAMRRMRRRSSAVNANSRLFCGTNGCPSFLEIDPGTGLATCHICGFVRRVH